MAKFEYKGSAFIENLNTRKENSKTDDEQELKVDLKLTIAVREVEISESLEPALRYFLFLEKGQVRNIKVSEVVFGYKMGDYCLSILGSTHFDVNIKNIKVKAHDGFVVFMTFTAQFKPTGSEIAKFAEYLKEHVDVVIEPATKED